MRTVFLAALLFLLGCTPGPEGPPVDVDERNDARGDAGTTSAPVGFLHRAGTKVVDGAGAPVKLRGVNVGGWLNWEGWMFGSGYVSESELLRRLEKLVGADETKAFHQAVTDGFLTEADLFEMQRLGFNVLRVPLNSRLLEDDAAPGAWKASGWAVLDRLLDQAERHGLYLVLDLHSAPCGQSGVFTNDPGTDDDPSARLLDSPACQQRTVDLWRALAARYASRTIVAGYDLLNEPGSEVCEGGPRAGLSCGPVDGCGLGGACVLHGERLVALYTRIIAAIREVDAQHLVVLEGASYASDFSIFSGRLDENQLYGAHHYSWGGKAPDEVLAGLEQVAQRDDTPVWVGEMGLDTAHQVTAAQVDSEEASPFITGWAYWSWKFTGASRWTWLVGENAVLRGITTTAAWNDVATALSADDAAQPTLARARLGMSEFLESIRFANTRYDPLTADALTPSLGGAPSVGAGTGARATYFADEALGTVQGTRVDETIDFDWGFGAPLSGMTSNHFSARWQAQLEAPRSGWYLFTLDADDGARLFVGGALVLDAWSGGPGKRQSVPVRLVEGEQTPLTLEYVEQLGAARVHLWWENARDAPAPVPRTQLFP